VNLHAKAGRPLVGLAVTLLLAGCAASASPASPSPSPAASAVATAAAANGCGPSASDRWAVADLSAFEAAFESGDYDQVRALFTDDGIMTTAWNTIGLYYGDTWESGTWDVNGSGFKDMVSTHRGEDMTVLGTPIQVGDNTVAFGLEWSSGVSGTALLHLRDGKIVVAVFNPSQAPITWKGIWRFPTGKWTATNDAGEVAVMEYGSDEEWSLTAAGSVITSGTYSTGGDTLEFLTDTLCKEQGAEQGTYTWTLDNDQLTFKKQTDECGARSGVMTDQAWTPVK
jgi:hypothetical protein